MMATGTSVVVNFGADVPHLLKGKGILKLIFKIHIFVGLT